MKIAFRQNNIRPDRLARIRTINNIINEYQKAGYKLTLRQLYYQLVSRDIIPNRQNEYDNLGTLLTDARMNGLVDWDAIEDRLRKPSSPPSWSSPAEGIDTIIRLYERPRMEGQEVYIEVWVEKDALSGVLSRVTRKYHVPIMVNRGYSSASAMFDAYERFREAINGGAEEVRVLYLGDFDPSGLDMIRDVRDRINEFFQDQPIDFDVNAIALTRAQIDRHRPPPNPAKRTDVRYKKFATEHGTTSWEVDALRPEVLDQILTSAIEKIIDNDKYQKACDAEAADIKKLKALKKHL